jgi:hypothetical protein
MELASKMQAEGFLLLIGNRILAEDDYRPGVLTLLER